MFRREKRVLLRHYLDQGVPKAEIARRVGVSRRTVYHWIETGQLDRELDAEPVRYGPRRRAPSKLDPYKAVIDDRLATYPKLSATRLYREVRESGYDGSYSQGVQGGQAKTKGKVERPISYVRSSFFYGRESSPTTI